MILNFATLTCKSKQVTYNYGKCESVLDISNVTVQTDNPKDEPNLRSDQTMNIMNVWYY